jgi:carbon storage regulator CsrA
MLIFTGRNVGDTIKLSDELALTVLAIEDNKVSVGIHVPMDIEIHKGEIRVRNENDA